MVLFNFGDCVYILLQAFKNTVYTFEIVLVYLAPILKEKRSKWRKRVFLLDSEATKLSGVGLWSLVCSVSVDSNPCFELASVGVKLGPLLGAIQSAERAGEVEEWQVL